LTSLDLAEDDDSSNNESVEDRRTFNQYWMQQMLIQGIGKNESLKPNFGAFAEYVANEFTPDDF